MSELSAATIGTLIAIPKEYGGLFVIDEVVSVTQANVKCKCVTLRKKDGLVIGSANTCGRRFARIATDSDILSNRIECAKSRLILITVTPENIDQIETLISGGAS